MVDVYFSAQARGDDKLPGHLYAGHRRAQHGRRRQSMQLEESRNAIAPESTPPRHLSRLVMLGRQLSLLYLGVGALVALAETGPSTSSRPSAGNNELRAGGGGTCNYRYTEHDGTPVVTSASCDISPKDLGTGTEPTYIGRDYVRQLGSHDGCDDDDAGHILANHLGGKAVPTNLFPQSPHLNRGDWAKLEEWIYNCIKVHRSSATLSWQFFYASTAKERPSRASYAVIFNHGCNGTKESFSNECSSL